MAIYNTLNNIAINYSRPTKLFGIFFLDSLYSSTLHNLKIYVDEYIKIYKSVFMGIKLSSIVNGKEFAIEELKGKKVAIDAFNWIFQFLTTIRGYDGEPLKDSKGCITSHLSGLFYRNINLIEAGAKLIYVFDGEPPEFKRKEIERRRELKEQARKQLEKAREEGREEGSEGEDNVFG